jgi:hypothetical protein
MISIMVEIFVQPLVGVCCNFQSKVLLRKRNLMRWELPLCSRLGCIKFFDLLGELKFRAIFLFALGVMYHDRFSFRNERNVRFDCSFLSVGLPADFLDWAGR